MAADEDRLISGLADLRVRKTAAGGWKIYEAPSERVSPGCLVVGAGLAVAAWLFTRGFEHALGWLWMLLTGAALWVIARRELGRTSIRIERGGVSIRSGMPWAERTTRLAVEQLLEVRVLERRRSRQSATSNAWHQYETYQIALAAAGNRVIPVFREIREKDLAGQAAERISAMLSGLAAEAREVVPVAWGAPPAQAMRLRTGIAIVAGAGLVFALIARAC